MRSRADDRAVWSRLAVAGAGVFIACLCSGLAGVLEVVSLARGRYEVGLEEGLKLTLAYGLAGLVLAILVAPLVLAIPQRCLAWVSGGSRVSRALFLVPTWTVTALAALFLNKRYFPPFPTPGFLAGNGAVALAALVIACVFARFERARRYAALGLGLLVCVCAGAFFLSVTSSPSSGSRAREAPRDARAVASRPTIVLVLIDTVRADHVGAYGYEVAVSPAIDALARNGVTFERAFSASNWTRPSIASLMSSTLPSTHGVISSSLALPPELPLLAQSLERAGYRSGFFTSNPNVEPEDGYGRGVEVFARFTQRGLLGRSFLIDDLLSKELPRAEILLRDLLGEETAGGYDPRFITEQALEWLEREAGGQFAYVHYAGAHEPYLAPERIVRELTETSSDELLAVPPRGWAGRRALTEQDRRQMILQYDAEILWHDQEVARLLDGLSDRQNLIVIVTADHGEAFGEFGVWGHSAGMFDEVVRVPLIIWCARGCGEARRVGEEVSLLDLAPTILELAGAQSPASFEGRSLVPLMRGETLKPQPVIIENPLSGEASIRTAEWNLALRPTASGLVSWLWQTGELPQESQPERDSEILADLKRLLDEAQSSRRLRAGSASSLEPDEDRVRELRALGYVD